MFDHPAKAGVYEKKMTLRNSRRNIPDLRAKAPKFSKLNLQFFPEGGNLIQGLPCVVAFKATNEQGEGVDVSGKILNDQNDEIADLTTVHGGMGYFSFLPDGKAYKAKVQYQGKEYTVALPESLPSGYELNVQNLQDDVTGIRCLYKGSSVLFVVNNNLVEDDIRDLYNVDDIKSIMISEDPIIFLKYCSDCNPVKNYTTIFLYTKVRKAIPANMRLTKIQGYSVAREFYNQKYDSNLLPKAPDVRRTLYWNPDVQTDFSGAATVQFYNNTSCKDINVDIEGFTK